MGPGLVVQQQPAATQAASEDVALLLEHTTLRDEAAPERKAQPST